MQCRCPNSAEIVSGGVNDDACEDDADDNEPFLLDREPRKPLLRVPGPPPAVAVAVAALPDGIDNDRRRDGGADAYPEPLASVDATPERAAADCHRDPAFGEPPCPDWSSRCSKV